MNSLTIPEKGVRLRDRKIVRFHLATDELATIHNRKRGRVFCERGQRQRESNVNQQTLEQLCSLYSLGSPTAPPERVPGGLIHHLYRLDTTRGQFAVKLLSTDTLTQTNFRDRVRQGERIAGAVAAAGLPAVAALTVAGQPLHDIGDATVLVYPWVNGRPLSSSAAGPDRAATIGAILARIHRLPLHFPEQILPAVETFTEVEWKHLADLGNNAGADWSDSLVAALPELARWGQSYEQAREALTGSWVISHGDLHQQNVLWTDEDTPWLIDWESAGWQQKAKEVLVCALEWSGFVEGEPDLPTFRAFLQAYRRESSLTTEEAVHGLDACFGNWLGWLRFCVRRALDTGATDTEQQTEDIRQIVGTLATVRRVEKVFPALHRACQE